MTDTDKQIPFITYTDFMRLLDNNRALEAQVTRQMDENDDLRACIKALEATVAELQIAILRVGNR